MTTFLFQADLTRYQALLEEKAGSGRFGTIVGFVAFGAVVFFGADVRFGAVATFAGLAVLALVWEVDTFWTNTAAANNIGASVINT